MYLIRLDDASEYINIEKWKRMETLLDAYCIKPIFGIIPANEDPDLLKMGKVDNFWIIANNWQKKGWIPALHGYTHVFETNEGGLNPINNRSEFAGVALAKQKDKIRNGYKILIEHGIEPSIFFAPAHTFDLNTLKAIKTETPIRVISDTIANDVYFMDGFYFIPQQSGRCRKLPFKTVTFCYHPNIMSDVDFDLLEEFLKSEKEKFGEYSAIKLTKRRLGIIDKVLIKIYFARK